MPKEDYTEVGVEKTAQTEFVFEAPEKVHELTPELIRAKLDEIGISHTILSRYIVGKIKRQNITNKFRKMF